MSAHPVIFLDIDGVLATNGTYTAWYLRAWDELYPAGPTPSSGTLALFKVKHLNANRPDVTVLDPECCAQVQALCVALGAKLVISSSWRRSFTLEELGAMFAAHGLTAPIVGATPLLARPKTRGDEIQLWLEQHPEFELDPKRDLWILEDEEDVRPLTGRQVQTAFHGRGRHPGFGARHLRRALQLAGAAEWQARAQPGAQPGGPS